MGLPRVLLSHATCADFTAAHHSTCGVHTHTHPYNVWYGATATCSGGRREILWEMWYLLQGLESEGMGLPRHVSSGATCVGFTAAHHCALPIPTILRHTPTMHRGVKADVHRGRWGGWLTSPGWGSVPQSPLPCHCSLRGLQEGSAVSHTHYP